MLFGFDLVATAAFDPVTFWSELGYDEIRPGTVALIASYRDEVKVVADRLQDFRAAAKKFDPLGRGGDFADAFRGIQQALVRNGDKFVKAVQLLEKTGTLETAELIDQLDLSRSTIKTLGDRIRASQGAAKDSRDREILGKFLDETAHALQVIASLKDDLLPKIQKAVEVIQPVREFATRIATGTIANLAAVDDRIRSRAEHWRIERMALVDRNILRLAVYEFLYEDTPRAVAINEALEIARKFSTFEATQFINGILDAIKLDLEKSAQSDDQKADGKANSTS